MGSARGRVYVAVRVQYKKRKGQECEVVVASAYFPYDVDAPPSKTVRDLIRDCEVEKIDMLMRREFIPHCMWKYGLQR